MPVAERSAARIAELLDRRPWAVTTARIDALGWSFGVRTNHAPLGRHLEHVLRTMATDRAPDHWYSIVVDARGGWQRHRVYRDAERLLDTPDATRAVRYLLWDVNQQAFRCSPDTLLVHASVVERDGRGVMMSAPSESGKTTLAMGLVERGFRYLSDEAAAIDPDSLEVRPFPKPLTVEVGAQDLLARLRPPIDAAIEEFVVGPWHLPPDAIRTDAVAASAVPIRWIVLPQHVAGATTRLTPYPRALTLARLVEQGLNLGGHGRHGFERLAEVVRAADCFELVMGDLPSACDAVIEMVDGSAPDA